MKVAWAIFKKEMRVYFSSPLAYVFLATLIFMSGLYFYLGVTMTNAASLRVMSANLSITLLFVLPLLTMRHIAEERRSGSFELMMTAPVPLWSLLLGKWSASVALCAIMLLGTFPLPLLLDYFGNPDWGVIFTTYMGLLLCCGAFVSAGLFSSSLSSDSVSAGIGGILLLLPFWLSGVSANYVDTQWVRELLLEMSFITHLSSFSKGSLDSADILWFLLFTIAFISLAWQSIESRRWR